MLAMHFCLSLASSGLSVRTGNARFSPRVSDWPTNVIDSFSISTSRFNAPTNFGASFAVKSSSKLLFKNDFFENTETSSASDPK